MFNALRSDELLVGVGRVLRSVARAEGALEEYERSQVLSAYSVTRLLAAEQASAATLLSSTKASLAAALGSDARPAVSEARSRIEEATDGVGLGDTVCDLLSAIPREDPLRIRVHRALAQMIDDEVAALAQPPK